MGDTTQLNALNNFVQSQILNFFFNLAFICLIVKKKNIVIRHFIWLGVDVVIDDNCLSYSAPSGKKMECILSSFMDVPFSFLTEQYYSHGICQKLLLIE